MKELIYQLLPRLWGNGRFSGLDEDSLDYFRSLGMDYVWYTGVIRHSTRLDIPGFPPQMVVKGEAGSPYAIYDYFDVNPYLAEDPARRMEEFESLISRTHKAGLKAIIDFVPNHVARENVNFGKDDNKEIHWLAENDFYYYPAELLQLPAPSHGYMEYPAKATGNAFTSRPGINDWWETVRLNYCPEHTATWDKMLEIVLFWAAKGVDGFRCDMVEMVPPEFMQWLIASVKEKYPSVIFIAEVYERDKYWKYSKEVGFDLLYDKSCLYDTLRAITCSDASAEGISWCREYLGALQGSVLNFLENHDEQRVASPFFAGSPQAGYAALAVSLLFNDAPFMLYFGEEKGERGGSDGRTSIFDICPVPALNNPDETVLQRYREALSLAKTPAFASGKSFDLCYCQGAPGFDRYRHFAWLRSDGVSAYLVVSNFAAASADILVSIPPEALDFLDLRLADTRFTLHVPSRDFRVLKLEVV